MFKHGKQTRFQSLRGSTRPSNFRSLIPQNSTLKDLASVKKELFSNSRSKDAVTHESQVYKELQLRAYKFWDVGSSDEKFQEETQRLKDSLKSSIKITDQFTFVTTKSDMLRLELDFVAKVFEAKHKKQTTSYEDYVKELFIHIKKNRNRISNDRPEAMFRTIREVFKHYYLSKQDLSIQKLKEDDLDEYYRTTSDIDIRMEQEETFDLEATFKVKEGSPISNMDKSENLPIDFADGELKVSQTPAAVEDPVIDKAIFKPNEKEKTIKLTKAEKKANYEGKFKKDITNNGANPSIEPIMNDDEDIDNSQCYYSDDSSSVEIITSKAVPEPGRNSRKNFIAGFQNSFPENTIKEEVDIVMSGSPIRNVTSGNIDKITENDFDGFTKVSCSKKKNRHKRNFKNHSLNNHYTHESVLNESDHDITLSRTPPRRDSERFADRTTRRRSNREKTLLPQRNSGAISKQSETLLRRDDFKSSSDRLKGAISQSFAWSSFAANENRAEDFGDTSKQDTTSEELVVISMGSEELKEDNRHSRLDKLKDLFFDVQADSLEALFADATLTEKDIDFVSHEKLSDNNGIGTDKKKKREILPDMKAVKRYKEDIVEQPTVSPKLGKAQRSSLLKKKPKNSKSKSLKLISLSISLSIENLQNMAHSKSHPSAEPPSAIIQGKIHLSNETEAKKDVEISRL